MITLNMWLDAKREQESELKYSPKKNEDLQKLGSPERLPPRYILAIAELEQLRHRF